MIKGYMYAHDYFNSFALTSISPLIGYFVLGYYIDNYGLKNEKYFIFLGILGLLITVFGTSFLSRNIGYATETFYASGTPNVYFTSVAVFVFAKEKLNKPKNAKLLLQLSKYTLCIYPIHPLIQSILNKNGITNMFFNPVYGVLFYFSLSYIC